MRYSLIILFLSCVTSALKAQQVPNGNMEIWHSTSASDSPVSWRTNSHYAFSTPYPVLVTATKTAEAYTGNWAIKLRTEEYNNAIQYVGFLACGDGSAYPSLSHGVAYTGRPFRLEFHYKFAPVGGDTAFAQVRLLKLDNTGNISQIIGEGVLSISQSMPNYTFATVPINYYTSGLPDVLQIAFSTNKTLFKQNKLSTTPGNGAHTGTTLWVDNINLTSSMMGIEEQQESGLTVFPNPAGQSFSVMLTHAAAKGGKFYLYNVSGQLVQEADFTNASRFTVDRNNLPSGIYMYKLITGNKASGSGKIVLN